MEAEYFIGKIRVLEIILPINHSANSMTDNLFDYGLSAIGFLPALFVAIINDGSLGNDRKMKDRSMELGCTRIIKKSYARSAIRKTHQPLSCR